MKRNLLGSIIWLVSSKVFDKPTGTAGCSATSSQPGPTTTGGIGESGPPLGASGYNPCVDDSALEAFSANSADASAYCSQLIPGGSTTTIAVVSTTIITSYFTTSTSIIYDSYQPTKYLTVSTATVIPTCSGPYVYSLRKRETDVPILQARDAPRPQDQPVPYALPKRESSEHALQPRDVPVPSFLQQYQTSAAMSACSCLLGSFTYSSYTPTTTTTTLSATYRALSISNVGSTITVSVLTTTVVKPCTYSSTTTSIPPNETPLLKNSGFELGNTSNWVCFSGCTSIGVSTTTVRTGQYAARVVQTTSSSIFQSGIFQSGLSFTRYPHSSSVSFAINIISNVTTPMPTCQARVNLSGDSSISLVGYPQPGSGWQYYYGKSTGTTTTADSTFAVIVQCSPFFAPASVQLFFDDINYLAY